MNVADVHTFSKVALTGSFSEAAKQIGVTRSAIGKSVSRLEEYLDVVLVRRASHAVTLTDAGRLFYEHLLVAEEEMLRAVAAVSGADQHPGGNVSCSLPSSIGAALMPLLIRDLRPVWPE